MTTVASVQVAITVVAITVAAATFAFGQARLVEQLLGNCSGNILPVLSKMRQPAIRLLLTLSLLN
jgi:hypothetical protein